MTFIWSWLKLGYWGTCKMKKLLYASLVIATIVALVLIAAGVSFLVEPSNLYTYGGDNTLNGGIVVWDNIIIETRPELALVVCYQTHWPLPDSMLVDC